jgi:hypothetical protein
MKSKEHKLCWPVDTAALKFASVISKPITMGKQKELLNLSNEAVEDAQKAGNKFDGDAFYTRLCVKESTGLSDEKIKLLVTPDLTSITAHVLKFLNESSKTLLKDELEKKQKAIRDKLLADDLSDQEKKHLEAELDTVTFKDDAPILLVPFIGDDGQKKSCYKLKLPTVGVTDAMDVYDDDFERALFISSACTGFSPIELERMSIPDWNHLQGRLTDFLTKMADYFHQ